MLQSCQKFVQSAVIFCGLLISSGLQPRETYAQPVQCDPTQVMTYQTCAKCHTNEVEVWKKTPHCQTFEQLSRRPAAKEICNKLGLRSAKRSDVCIDCHYTMQEKNGRNKAISGVSCESCHGASRDWINIHNDYGGPTMTKETESTQHRQQRLERAAQYGMRNTRNLYSIASSCFGCHTVPNEELVNVGGHQAGSEDFELVAWSQGQVRHNFLRTGGKFNATSDRERLRLMYVVGLIADLEFSTRATAKATEKSVYGIKVANRAARTAIKLYRLQQQIQDPNVQQALVAFSNAELKINNEAQLNQITAEINRAGTAFAQTSNGAELEEVDPLLPDVSQYK